MSKKILKFLICLAGIAAAVAGIIYLINNQKNKNAACDDNDEFETEEETLDTADALDLSSLKFSRHYVDLR